MKLKEYDLLIQNLVDKDKSNEEIFIHLQKMIEMFLWHKKCCDCANDVETISYTMAEDIYLDILNGRPFKQYLSYVSTVYHKYLRECYDKNIIRQLNYDDIIAYKEREHERIATHSQEIHNTESKVYLENISNTIDRVLHYSCKYDENTAAYINLKMSLMLSLYRGYLVYFHLTKEQEFYLKLIVTNFYNTIKKDGLDING